MNTLPHPQSPTSLRADSSSGHSSSGRRSANPIRRASRRITLSAQQLMDIELGLFVLSQLLPTAPPSALPTLLTDNGSSFLERPTWTPKQLRLLNRGRIMLGHMQQLSVWTALLEAYVNIPERLQAYDISTDRNRFAEKTVGFFRNRIITLRQTVA